MSIRKDKLIFLNGKKSRHSKYSIYGVQYTIKCYYEDKQENVPNNKDNKQWIDIDPEMTEMLELEDKESKVAVKAQLRKKN